MLCACNSDDGLKTQTDQNKISEKSNTEIPEIDSIPSEVNFNLLNQENYAAYLRDYFIENTERRFKLTTRIGTIKVRLYEDTPLHTANFIMLIKREYFNNTEFTRVAKNFVVQGGNNDNELEEIKRILIGSYEIEPELNEAHMHTKGVLAMARRYTENPDKLSSSYDFYFVQGQVFNEPQLLGIERENEIVIPEWKRKIYRDLGGAPHLDGEHTVFGEIYEGLDVLEKMSNVPTDESDWPLQPLIIEVELID